MLKLKHRMNFRTKLLTILFLATGLIASAQDYKKVIENEFNDYLNTIVNMEFEKSMDYLTPEFFEIIPRSEMLKVMEQTFNNPAIEYEMENPRILKINDAREIENKYYSLLTYTNQMNIKILGEDEETEDEKNVRNKMTKLAFDQNFGSDNVKFNNETGFFEIQSENDVYAISENGQSGWKFLVIEENLKPILEKILPQQLTDKK